jgi:hypothetical protein
MPSVRRKRRFLVCVRNTGCNDLELRKLYERLPDAVAKREGYVRVVDESGEDYLYPDSYFVGVELPRRAERAVGRRATARAVGAEEQRLIRRRARQGR